MLHFYEWRECFDFLRNQEESYEICAISRYGTSFNVCDDNSTPLMESIDKKQFSKSCAFVLTHSLQKPSEVIQQCDSRVFVPFPQEDYDHFIKYESKLSVVLWKYTCQFQESFKSKSFTGEKFDINEEEVSTITVKSMSKRTNALSEEDIDLGSVSIFGDEDGNY